MAKYEMKNQYLGKIELNGNEDPCMLYVDNNNIYSFEILDNDTISPQVGLSGYSKITERALFTSRVGDKFQFHNILKNQNTGGYYCDYITENIEDKLIDKVELYLNMKIIGKSQKLNLVVNEKINLFENKVIYEKEGLNFQEIEKYCIDMKRLLSLQIGDHVFFSEIRLYRKDGNGVLKALKESTNEYIKNNGGGQEVRCDKEYLSIKMYKNQGKLSHLIPYGKANNNESKVDRNKIFDITNIVFENASSEKLSTIWDLYYSGIDFNQTVENNFLNLIQGLEGGFWVSSIEVDSTKVMSLSKTKKDKLEKGIKSEKVKIQKSKTEEEDETIFMKRDDPEAVNDTNERKPYFLIQRLTKIQEYIGLENLYDDKIKTIKDIRDIFSHGGNRYEIIKKCEFKDYYYDMKNLNTLMRIILELFLLKEIGINDTEYKNISELKKQELVREIIQY